MFSAPVGHIPCSSRAWFRRVATLKRRTAARLGIENPPWISVVGDLIAAKGGYKPRSWRLYKFALLAIMDEVAVAAGQSSDLDGATAKLRHENASGALTSSTRTSATKAKSLPASDREAIFAELQISRSPLATVLVHFITATNATGLRPIEWRSVLIEEPSAGASLRLIVRNAKATNGSHHSSLRHPGNRRMSDEPIRFFSLLAGLSHRARCAWVMRDIQPSLMTSLWVEPSSTSGSLGGRLSMISPSNEAKSTPRSMPSGFSTRIS